MDNTKPFLCAPMKVEPGWIDYNGHMNMAYYNVLFDRCCDQAYNELGIGEAYARERRLTTYTAEVHICYLRELHLGDRITCTFQIIDHDEKRIHAFQELYHVDGWISATAELLTLHIDMDGPRVTNFPADISEAINNMAAAHSLLPRPERAGRNIAIRRKRN